MADDTWRRNDPDGLQPPRRDDDYDRGPSYRERPHYEEPHRGTLLLVLGILSVAGVCYLTGPFAWVMANGDLKKMDAGMMDPEGRGLTQAGKITGMIGTIFLILGCIGAIIWVAFMVFIIGAAGAGR